MVLSFWEFCSLQWRLEAGRPIYCSDPMALGLLEDQVPCVQIPGQGGVCGI